MSALCQSLSLSLAVDKLSTVRTSFLFGTCLTEAPPSLFNFSVTNNSGSSKFVYLGSTIFTHERPPFKAYSLLQNLSKNLNSGEKDQSTSGNEAFADDGYDDEAPLESSSVMNQTNFTPLTNAEKKSLRAYAHQMGKDIVTQQIGKWGVTPALIKSIGDALEKNELIKMKVMENCPSEMDDVIIEIQKLTDAQVVGKLGRTILVYRPSLKKLKKPETREPKAQKMTKPKQNYRPRR